MQNVVLVTGGAGFLGSHLCEKLLQFDNYVICVDNFFTGKMLNICHLIGNKNFEVIRHDINLPCNIIADQIYNLACPASPIHYQFDPVRTVTTCVIGGINMLELARKNKGKVLQASTSEVYGDPKEHPQLESYHGNVNMIGARSCYDEGKRIAETLFFDYRRQYGVDIKIVRIFNAYGPRMQKNDGRVVSNFIIQALLNEDMLIYGDGLQTRSFCYVDDLISGLIMMMDSNADFVGPVNIGNPHEITIKELAELIIRKTCSRSKCVHKKLPEDDPFKRKPDISLAVKKLKWHPTVDLSEGLDKTIEFFRKLLDLE
jgi:UDP-glucuronate decarboxylase